METKQIRILVSIAGLAEPRYNLPEFAYQPGDVATVHADLAAAWIAAGIAEPAEPAGKRPAAQKGKGK